MRLLLILTLLPQLLSAQSAFLKDPDIVWAAEIEQDWVVDIPSLENESEQGITTLKLLRTEKNEGTWSSPYLADLVFQAAQQGHLAIFDDPRCQNPSDFFRHYPRLDSMVTFDPETYEEKMQVIHVEINPASEFKAWRLRQVLAYHRKSATWSTTVESIAPLVVIKNMEGDSIGIKPLFWFQPDNERQKTASNDVVWAKRTKNFPKQTRVSTTFETLVKVTDGFQNPLYHLIEELHKNEKTPIYDISDWKVIPLDRRRDLLAPPDTVITLDVETMERKTLAVRNDINVADIYGLRLVQTWYWNERRQRLSICLDAVAPMLDVRDRDGLIRYSKLLFYRKAKGAP